MYDLVVLGQHVGLVSPMLLVQLPAVLLPGNNSGQVVHTHVSLLPSSVIWYQLNRWECSCSIWVRCALSSL